MKNLKFFFADFLWVSLKPKYSIPCVSYNGKLHIPHLGEEDPENSEFYPYIDSSLRFPCISEKPILKEVPPEAFLTSNSVARHFAESVLEGDERWVEIIFEILEDNERRLRQLDPFRSYLLTSADLVEIK